MLLAFVRRGDQKKIFRISPSLLCSPLALAADGRPAPLKDAGCPSIEGGLTPEPHPLQSCSTSAPHWHMLHPCHTDAAVNGVLGPATADCPGLRYLLAWLGLAASAVGLSAEEGAPTAADARMALARVATPVAAQHVKEET